MKKNQAVRWILLSAGLILSQFNTWGEVKADLPVLKGYCYSQSEFNAPFIGDPSKEAHSLFNDPEVFLHGFFLDYTKLKSIMKNGLLSLVELQKRGIIPSLVFGVDGEDGEVSGYNNGRNQISLSSVRLMNGKPPCYDIIDAMTLVIKGISMNFGGSFGAAGSEARVDDCIPPEYFAGIIVPKDLLSRPINQIDFMLGYADNLASAEAERLVLISKTQYLKKDFNIEDPWLRHVLDIIQDDSFALSSKGFKNVAKLINELICQGFEQKLGRPQHQITFWDIIKPLLPENFPIYDENGYLIEDIWNKEGYELLTADIHQHEDL